MGRRRRIFVFAISLLLHILDFCRGSKIGVCYGRNADDLPTPDKVAKLVQQHNIKYLRIYDSNIQVLKAFTNTSVELMIGIPNSDLLSFSQSQSNADTWLKNNVLPYHPATKITYITVGAEVTEASNNASAFVVPAMQNVLKALKKVGLQKRIKISSPHSLGILSRSFPSSAGAFNSSHAFFLKPMLEFLAENQSPFMINIYPYYAFQDSPNKVALDYALFRSSKEVIDPNTGLLYTNMFDAQIDAIYFALTSLNYRTINVMVTETGWPSKGSRNEKAANPDNAQTYNTNLIHHVVNNSGTPFKPGEKNLDVYIFSLFNENRKPGLESERNWGMFYPDQTSVYNMDFSGKMILDGNVTSVNGTMTSSWCVASTKASEIELQSGIDWACDRGNVDCSAIQPSQPCYEPDTLLSHASYVFNNYYRQNGASDVSCSFGGAGIKVNKDPSYDDCIYITAGGNKTVASNTRAISKSSSSAISESLTLVLCTLLVVSCFLGA